MSKRRCRDHKRFPDEIAASLGLLDERLADNHHRPHAPRRVYECQICAGWHLTTLGVRGLPVGAKR